MELTTTQLHYLLACYSMVFSLAGLLLFMKGYCYLAKMYDLLESIINLIHRNGEHLTVNEQINQPDYYEQKETNND